jgi:hypothetical protein
MTGGGRDPISERGRRQRGNLPVATNVMLGGVEVGEGEEVGEDVMRLM